MIRYFPFQNQRSDREQTLSFPHLDEPSLITGRSSWRGHHVSNYLLDLPAMKGVANNRCGHQNKPNQKNGADQIRKPVAVL
jgi:hypothetical protein